MHTSIFYTKKEKTKNISGERIQYALVAGWHCQNFGQNYQTPCAFLIHSIGKQTY